MTLPISIRRVLSIIGVSLTGATACAVCYLGLSDGTYCGPHNMNANCATDRGVVKCQPNQCCAPTSGWGFTSCNLQSVPCWCEWYRLAKHVEGNNCTCGPEKDPNSVVFSGYSGYRTVVYPGFQCSGT